MQGELKNHKIVLNSRPVGMPLAENFRLEESMIIQPGEGEVLMRVHYLSLDPYMRRRMDDRASYAPPVGLGDVMVGGTVGEVITSRHPSFKEGDMVEGMGGWQQYAVLKGAALRKIDVTMAPASTALGILGMPGMTAYTGLLNIGKPQKGETLVVAAASGAVGAAVGQIAKIKGCRVVGIAGGHLKTRYLIDELGFDAAIDHRAPDFNKQLAHACPKGIDIYFENVGGFIFKAILPLLNPFARIPVCGLIAHANDTAAPEGPDHVPDLFRSILTKKLTVRGFIVHDFSDQAEAFYKEMGRWIKDEMIRYREDMIDGLERAPDAFIGLLQGRNFGKLLVRMEK